MNVVASNEVCAWDFQDVHVNGFCVRLVVINDEPVPFATIHDNGRSGVVMDGYCSLCRKNGDGEGDCIHKDALWDALWTAIAASRDEYEAEMLAEENLRAA